MKKFTKFIALFLAILSLCAVAMPAMAADTTKWVTGGSLRFRSSPNSSSSDNVLFSIPDGMPVVVNSTRSDGWSFITFNGRDGYVMSKFLTTTAASLTPETQAQAFGYPLLRKGDNNNLFVYNLQLCLKELGFFSGTATGYFGNDTYEAVCNYQRVRELTKVDGIVGDETKGRLFPECKTFLKNNGVKKLP